MPTGRSPYRQEHGGNAGWCASHLGGLWPVCRPVGRSSNSGRGHRLGACDAAAGGVQVVFVDTGGSRTWNEWRGRCVLGPGGAKVELAFRWRRPAGRPRQHCVNRRRHVDVGGDRGRPAARHVASGVGGGGTVNGPARGTCLEKTELRIERIGLSGANLTDVATAVPASSTGTTRSWSSTLAMTCSPLSAASLDQSLPARRRRSACSTRSGRCLG